MEHRHHQQNQQLMSRLNKGYANSHFVKNQHHAVNVVSGASDVSSSSSATATATSVPPPPQPTTIQYHKPMFELPLFEQVHLRPIVQIRVLEHDGRRASMEDMMTPRSNIALQQQQQAQQQPNESVAQSLFEDVFGLKKMSFHHGRTHLDYNNQVTSGTGSGNNSDGTSVVRKSSFSGIGNSLKRVQRSVSNSSPTSAKSTNTQTNTTVQSPPKGGGSGGGATTSSTTNVVQLYRCQVKFTCDHLRDWNRLMMGDDYECGLAQSVVFQFEFANDYQGPATASNSLSSNHGHTMFDGNHDDYYNGNGDGDCRSDSNEAYFQMLSEYDGTLIVLAPGTTLQSFENTFLRDMRLTPEKIVAHNIHFLNICPPKYLCSDNDGTMSSNNDSDCTSMDNESRTNNTAGEWFDVDRIDARIRCYIHNLFPKDLSGNSPSTQRDLNMSSSSSSGRNTRGSPSPPLHSSTYDGDSDGGSGDGGDDDADLASSAVDKLFHSNDTTALNNLFKRTILRMLLDVYKYDRFSVGYDLKGYKEALLRHEFMYDKLLLLSKLEYPYFGAELACLNDNFNLDVCQVQFTNHMAPVFDPMKMLSKLGWEDLGYDTQLAIVQTYTKHYLFQLVSPSHPLAQSQSLLSSMYPSSRQQRQQQQQQTEYVTIFLTAEDLSHYTKYLKNQRKSNSNSSSNSSSSSPSPPLLNGGAASDHAMTQIARVVSMGKFGKNGLPNYKAPTYSIDYRLQMINVDVWVCEYPVLSNNKNNSSNNGGGSLTAETDTSELPEEVVTFSHWRYSFPCIGVRMKLARLFQFCAADHRRKKPKSSLFSCLVGL